MKGNHGLVDFHRLLIVSEVAYNAHNLRDWEEALAAAVEAVKSLS